MTQRIQNLTLPQREALHSAPAPDLERHSRKCAICNHPQREAIDAAFVRWHSPGEIMEGYDLDFSYAALYRHAHATGLTELRSRNLLPALEHIIESAEQTTPTAAGVISAIRAYVCLTNPGQWNEPPRRVSIDYNIHNASQSIPQPESVAPPPIPPGPVPPPPAAASAYSAPRRAIGFSGARSVCSVPRRDSGPVADPIPQGGVLDPLPSTSRSQPAVSNREYEKLEPPLTHTKQTTAPPSNRENSDFFAAPPPQESPVLPQPSAHHQNAFSLSSLPPIAYNRHLFSRLEEAHGQAHRSENHRGGRIRPAARGHQLRPRENRGNER